MNMLPLSKSRDSQPLQGWWVIDMLMIGLQWVWERGVWRCRVKEIGAWGAGKRAWG